MIFLTFIHRIKNTLTAVNLQKLIEMRSYWFVSYFDWRKLLHFAVTHLHGILSLDCIRRNTCVEMLEPFSLGLCLMLKGWANRRQFQLHSLTLLLPLETVSFKDANCIAKSNWHRKYLGQCTVPFDPFCRRICAQGLGALSISCIDKGSHNLSLLETSLGWIWWGLCAIAGIGRNKTCNLSGSKEI